MPVLLIFTACEKVIIDRNELISLISIIEKLEVTLPAGLQIPPHSAFPMRWQSFSMWSMDRSEVGQYEQKTDVLVVESGDIAMHTEPIRLESTTAGPRPGAKIISALAAVPIVNGLLHLRLFYRRIGEEQWTHAATFPIEVVVTQQ